MICKFEKKPKYSKEVEDWIKAGGVIKGVPPKKTAAKLNKLSGGYFKGKYAIGPSKKVGRYA